MSGQPYQRLTRPPMLLFCLVFIALSALTAPATADVQPSLTWRDDPDPNSLLPLDDARPLLLYFTAAWCGPCRLLEREVFAHPAGLAELSHYHLIRLDLDSINGRLLADNQRVQTAPTFVMLAVDGQEIERISGYRSRRLLLRDLARFRNGKGTLADLQRRLDAQPDDTLLRLELGLRHHARQEISMAIDVLAPSLAALYEPTQSVPRLKSDGASEFTEASQTQIRHARSAASGSRELTASSAVMDTVVTEAARALAHIHRRLGQPELAAQVLEGLLENWPHHPFPRVTWQLLADCRRESGYAPAAAEALREAAMIEPPCADLLSLYAVAVIECGGDLMTAEAAARKAVALTGTRDSPAMAVLAQVLRHRRHYPEAMLWIKRAEAASPTDPRWTEQRQAILRAAIDGN